MESILHLRNQTLPFVFSFPIRWLDQFGLNNPRIYLILIHSTIAVVSWISFCALVESIPESRTRFREERLASDWDSFSGRVTQGLGWFFALYWAFPFLYSRSLLEAVSLPTTLLLLVALRRGRPAWAGFCAGLTLVFRYPSALWALGALGVLFWRRPRRLGQALAWGSFGFALAIVLGGLADLVTYGHFLESALNYWNFNRPHGPVEKMFGSDSLAVYWRWFEFIFTPWIALPFLAAATIALARSPELLIFSAPYLIGHLWTPHREPRFMLPLTPILCLAIAETLIRDRQRVQRLLGRASASPAWPVVRAGLLGILFAHIALNFAWIPMNVWAQARSTQGVLLRQWPKLAEARTRLVDLGDPVIDAFIPEKTRWAQADCIWHRPLPPTQDAVRLWVLAESNPLPGKRDCFEVEDDRVPDLPSPLFNRLLRVRTGRIWDCPDAALRAICPMGMKEADPREAVQSLKTPGT